MLSTIVKIEKPYAPKHNVPSQSMIVKAKKEIANAIASIKSGVYVF